MTIDLGKEKFKSAVKEKAVNPEWNEECDLLVHCHRMELCQLLAVCIISSMYGIVCHCLNRAASDGQLPLTITAFHRNLLGTDDFLGQATISLDQFKPNDKPRSGYVEY